MKTINAGEANRQFSSLLRAAIEGDEVLILSRGRPVARLVAASDSPQVRRRARIALLRRLKAQKPTGARRWRRDELYSG
ncbi:MAG: type II toxin-antitoxin system Phd/YefM family antitoxin [Gammaproteobacteria bacterium]